MFYVAIVHREGKSYLADFPDAPGCQTFAPTKEALRVRAKEALEGWLEAHLVDGQVPQHPKTRVRNPEHYEEWRVRLRPTLSVAVQLRWKRHELGLTQKELAEKTGVSQQQIAKLEDPDGNPTLETVQNVAEQLGLSVEITLDD